MSKGSFQIRVLALVQLITENRLRHGSGPVHFTSSPLHVIGTRPGYHLLNINIPFCTLCINLILRSGFKPLFVLSVLMVNCDLNNNTFKLFGSSKSRDLSESF